MVGFRPSISFIFSALVRGAVAVAALAALLLVPGREASAAGPFDLEGVHCMDVYLDNSPLLVNKGDPAGPEDDRATKILTRIEPAGGDWDVTSVAYTGPGGLTPTKPPSAEDCNTKGDGNSLNPSVDFQQIDLNDRPTDTAQVVQKGPDLNLEWEVCKEEPELLGTGFWVLSKFEIVVDGKSSSPDYGTLTAYLDTTQCTTEPDFWTSTLIVESFQRTATKGEPQPGPDDWDGDGHSDWDELSLSPPPAGRDPFNPGVVGGIAGLPEVTGAPLGALDSSGGSAGLFIAIAAAVATGALTLGGGAFWYARKRRTS